MAVVIVPHIVALLLCVLWAVAKRAGEKRRAAAEAAEREAAARQQAARREAAKRRADEQRAARERAACQNRAEREQIAAEKHAAKVARAEELAQLAERKLNAEKELAALKKQPAPIPAQPERHETIPAAPQPVMPQANAPQSFVGEVVAFTGTLPTMTRSEAIEATQARGGRAYERINAKCTLLVVGEKPGKGQQEQAARWHVKTITWREWFERAEISYRRRMVGKAIAAEIVTMTPDEFAAAVAAM